MLIAKLRISLRDAAIQYNRADELGTSTTRGTVLADGKVIRGLGTHFLNAAAQQRFDKLTSESNAIREKFNRRFLRSPIDGVYVIGNKGEAKEFVKALAYDGGLEVWVTEFELGNTNGGLDSTEMTAWAGKVKTQLEKIPLGRGKKETIDPEGIAALEALSKCPVLSAETAAAISALAVQAKANQCDRVELKRSIELLTVTMDQGSLDLKRGGAL
jgi:hypothetical protein